METVNYYYYYHFCFIEHIKSLEAMEFKNCFEWNFYSIHIKPAVNSRISVIFKAQIKKVFFPPFMIEV